MKYAMLALLAFAMGGLIPSAYAAHAGAPYKHVNKKTDAGNATGDSEVDRLNSMQLEQNYHGPTYTQGQEPPPAVAMMPPANPAPSARGK